MEFSLDRRKGDVHYGAIEHHHELAHGEHDKCEPSSSPTCLEGPVALSHPLGHAYGSLDWPVHRKDPRCRR